MSDYREQIAGTIVPVRPLPAPARRTSLLVPIGLLVAVFSPTLYGQRGDLGADPLVMWVATAAQAIVGLWILSLGFREAVPGRNISRAALAIAIALSAALFAGITIATNAASATVVPTGRELQYWKECVVGPLIVGAPFMVLATLLSARAFPTRPAMTGALCGASAGILSDSGWRLSCWISQPSHVITSHALAVLALAAAGSLVAVAMDWRRWSRLRDGSSSHRAGRES
jgi:hypothetical protein